MENSEEFKQFVTKDMKISEIIMQYPEAVPILMGYGLHCVGCHLSDIDTLENGAKIHGIDDETLNMMIKDINTILTQFKKNS